MASYSSGGGAGGEGGSWGDSSTSMPSIFKKLQAANTLMNLPETQQAFKNYTASSSGGGTSGVVNTNADLGGGVPMEDTGSADEGYNEAQRIIDEAYNSAVSALDQFQSTLQPGFEQTRSELLGEQQTKTARAREEERRGVGELTQQGQEETGKAESAIAKSRREATEMMQGLAARFGGSTGTGMFGGEILGRQALENISGNRQALQYVMGKITAAQENIKRETDLYVNNLDQQTQDLIGQARQQLNQSLADIAGRRSELESAKAQMRLDALGQYQDTLNAVNQRNTQLKQSIYLKAQDAAQRLASMSSGFGKLDISTSYKPFEGWGMSATGVTPDNLSVLQQIQGQLSGTPEAGLTTTGAGALDTNTQQDLTAWLTE